MSSHPLIVPVQLPDHSLQFANVTSVSTVRDVLEDLVKIHEVKVEVLGDLVCQEWALQRVRKERIGRPWEEHELESLGNGLLDPSTSIAPILEVVTTPRSSDPERHFSAFPLTSHLHTPLVRLVSLHPWLSVPLVFQRVPEVHDDFKWTVFISRNSTAEQVINTVVEELGLTRTLPVPGGGNLEYVLEEVWTSEEEEKCSRISLNVIMSNIVETPIITPTFPENAKRQIRFCVPDEWYRRSKIRNIPLSSEPSAETVKRLADMNDTEDGDDDEGEGTAKQKRLSDAQSSTSSTQTFQPGVEWRNSVAQSRLSSLFEGWRASSPIVDPGIPRNLERKSVSEPKLIDTTYNEGIGELSEALSNKPSNVGPDPAAFEELLDDLGLKGERREAMYALSPERKQFLLKSNNESRSATLSRASTKPTHMASPSLSASYGPSSGSGLLPRLVPQLTGDNGIMKRFSITGWGSVTPTSDGADVPLSLPSLSSSIKDTSTLSRRRMASTEEQTKPIQPQGTGGLWSSWWTSSGGDKSGEKAKTAQWYVDGIKNAKGMDLKLVKHLISLRVHISTAQVVWIDEFVVDYHGLDALGTVLSALVGKGDKRRRLSENEESVLLETIKCLRVLLNTEIGFNEVLSAPTIISHIAYSLYEAAPRLRTLVSEVLAAIAILSIPKVARPLSHIFFIFVFFLGIYI